MRPITLFMMMVFDDSSHLKIFIKDRRLSYFPSEDLDIRFITPYVSCVFILRVFMTKRERSIFLNLGHKLRPDDLGDPLEASCNTMYSDHNDHIASVVILKFTSAS